MRSPSLAASLAVLSVARLGAQRPRDIAYRVVADAPAPDAVRQLGRAWLAGT